MPAATRMRARGQWIRVMNTLRSLIDTIGTEDLSVLDLVHRLEVVSHQATRRPGAGDAAPAGEEAGDDDVGSAADSEEPGDDEAPDGAPVVPLDAKEPPAS